MRRRKRIVTASAAIGSGLLVALLVPEPARSPPEAGAGEPFVWDSDALWEALEARFAEARARGCDATEAGLDAAFAEVDASLDALAASEAAFDEDLLAAVERALFDAAPLVGACPDRTDELVARATRTREVVKRASRQFDLGDRTQRARLYRLLYGSRMAVEELLLQRAPSDIEALTLGTDEPSRAPSARLLGVAVRSGDILVSRGGAPTSALIARGNDHPGNFSHIALLHVAESGDAHVIEAHIETGVVVSTLEQYLADTKLRIMVLRLASDLDAVTADPLLPHRAATRALDEARSRHVPYDFAMDYAEHSKMFCSEVASAPYGALGVPLWEGLTSMSTRGVRRWLAGFGVERFETHGPSDLEYDPKVVVVAEWRDPETLFSDHVDNAVLDAMLEGAEEGDALDYDYAMLAPARLAKGWSVLENLFGEVGPVPEGMTATTALRAEWLRARHAHVREGTLARVAAFRREQRYTPPYWELVRMARESRASLE